MTTTHEVINPATEEVVATVPPASVEDADAAIAQTGAAAWARAMAASASSTEASGTVATTSSVAGLMTSWVVVTVARILSCAPSP